MTWRSSPLLALSALGVAMELMGIAAFTRIAARWPDPGKALVVVVFTVAIGLVMTAAFRRLSRDQTVYFLLLLSLGLVCAIEALGWTVLDGLRHDIRPFSPYHSRVLLGTWLLGLVYFGSLLGLITIADRILRLRRERLK